MVPLDHPVITAGDDGAARAGCDQRPSSKRAVLRRAARSRGDRGPRALRQETAKPSATAHEFAGDLRPWPEGRLIEARAVLLHQERSGRVSREKGQGCVGAQNIRHHFLSSIRIHFVRDRSQWPEGRRSPADETPLSSLLAGPAACRARFPAARTRGHPA